MIHDSHTHTLHSDGLGEVFENIAEAERKGLSLVAITDHSHLIGNFNAYLSEIRRWRKDSEITVLAGIEGNVTPNGVDVPDWIAKKFDFVIASVHEWVDRPEQYVELVKTALLDENVDVIGHFGASFPYIGYPSWEELLELIALAEERGKAFEISSRYRVPDLEFVRECIRRGVKLTFASDAHRPERVGNVGWSVSIFKKAGGKLGDLLFAPYL